ncbi:6,7-dimethyl-8-ribityllumazine synthase [Bacteroidota bacterium]
MATSLKNLSEYNPDEIPSGEGKRIGIILADWNQEITGALLDGTVRTLRKHGVKETDIIIEHVPGSFELPLGAQLMAESQDPDAVICLGCVIQGETRHFDFICQGVTKGITELNLKFGKPFVFGVLTTDTLQQAKDRSGGKHGNKGDEAAITALKMAHLRETID